MWFDELEDYSNKEYSTNKLRTTNLKIQAIEQKLERRKTIATILLVWMCASQWVLFTAGKYTNSNSLIIEVCIRIVVITCLRYVYTFMSKREVLDVVSNDLLKDDEQD